MSVIKVIIGVWRERIDIWRSRRRIICVLVSVFPLVTFSVSSRHGGVPHPC
jgi:hypothetical protein